MTSATDQESSWKKNGRNGPFDWWLTCKDHGYTYMPNCLSCSVAFAHNLDFEVKLKREREREQQLYHTVLVPTLKLPEEYWSWMD